MKYQEVIFRNNFVQILNNELTAAVFATTRLFKKLIEHFAYFFKGGPIDTVAGFCTFHRSVYQTHFF